MTAPSRQDLLALAILASLVTLLFIDVLAGVNGLADRDLLVYSYPGKKVLREVVLGHEFPYWNRAISGGQPMAANPAHEVFYPLTWLILLPDFDAAFQWFIVLHVYLAAAAMYGLLRSLSLSPVASSFGATSFALGGVFLSYLTLLPFLASVAWMPLTLLLARRFLLHRSPRDFAMAAVCMAIQVTIGEPTTLLQTGALIVLYATCTGWRTGGAREAARAVGLVGLICGAALLVGAVAALPAIDHARDSVRARGFPFVEVTDWSLPPVRLAELIHANLLGHGTLDGVRLYWGRVLYGARNIPFLMSVYPGLLVTVLAIAGVFARVKGRALFLAILSLSIVLAFGAHTPLWQVLYEAGLARSIRYPEKFLLMGLFSMIVFAACALERLLGKDERVRVWAIRTALGVALLTGVAALIASTPLHTRLFATMWSPPPSVLVSMLAAARSGWIMAAARAILVLVLLRAVSRGRRRLWLALAATFVLLDLGLLVPELARRSEPEFLSARPAMLRNLPPAAAQYRVFHQAAWHRGRAEIQGLYQLHPDSPWINRNAAMPMIPVAHGIQLSMAVDFDYTALLSTTEFVDVVTTKLPNLRRDWVELAASMSNVWYRVVYRDPREAMAEVQGDRRQLQAVGLLRLPRSPRYSFASSLKTIRGPADFVRELTPGRSSAGTAFVKGPSFVPAAGTVHRAVETANTARIEVETAGRAFLVMSVTPHKYWTITVDGRDAEAMVTNLGYQGVTIPEAGRHVVEMRYRNPLISAGAAISGAAILALIFIARRRPRAVTMRAL